MIWIGVAAIVLLAVIVWKVVRHESEDERKRDAINAANDPKRNTTVPR